MSDLNVTVDLSAAEPPYEQVRTQLAGHIATGALAPGDQLPPIRVLAADLGLATNTVGRAYKELESSGLVQTRRRTGTVVTSSTAPIDPVLATGATSYARSAIRQGLTEAQTVDLLRATYRNLKRA